jgi:hypothetical protein
MNMLIQTLVTLVLFLGLIAVYYFPLLFLLLVVALVVYEDKIPRFPNNKPKPPSRYNDRL